MTVLIVSALLALAILRAGLHRAPLITLLCVGLIGFGLHTGALTLPAAVRTPAAHLSSDVRAWQDRQADALGCELAQASAARNGDEASLDRASQLCPPADATAP